jgi:hypothetical protein
MKDTRDEIINNKEEDKRQENQNQKNNTFNIIIGVSTLLIAILGATFAYFSATARSAEGDVNVKSAYVSISYDGGTEIKASNLIPATQTVAIKKYQKEVNSIGTIDDDSLEFLDEDKYTNDLDRRCIDANGREVCYVYQFTINSDGEAGKTTAITGSIKVDSNEFDNLSYMLYEVTFRKGTNGKELVDKFGHKIVDTYTLVSEFDKTDTNSDNIDYTEAKFATFEKPFDSKGENEEISGTVYPVACLFGYSETYATDAKDDTARCKTANITNQESHTYQLMIWLEETGKVQEEQGLSFKGTVSLEVPGGQDASDYETGQITGKQ